MNVYYHSMGCTTLNYHIVNHTEIGARLASHRISLTAPWQAVLGFTCSIFSNTQARQRNLLCFSEFSVSLISPFPELKLERKWGS